MISSTFALGRRHQLPPPDIRIVRALGHAPNPAAFGAVARLPRGALAALFWVLGRTRMSRDLGALGEAEPRMLIDMMSAAAPELAAPLRAIRP